MTNDWLKILEQQIKARGMRAIARELGYSHTTLSLVRSGKYKQLKHFISRVMALYGNGGRVPCPVLGNIAPGKCADHFEQAKRVGIRVGNPNTMLLHKTCLACPVRGGKS